MGGFSIQYFVLHSGCLSPFLYFLFAFNTTFFKVSNDCLFDKRMVAIFLLISLSSLGYLCLTYNQSQVRKILAIFLLISLSSLGYLCLPVPYVQPITSPKHFGANFMLSEDEILDAILFLIFSTDIYICSLQFLLENVLIIFKKSWK